MRLECRFLQRSRDRVAEGAPLLREYVGKTCIEGSNPSDSASSYLIFSGLQHWPCVSRAVQSQPFIKLDETL